MMPMANRTSLAPATTHCHRSWTNEAQLSSANDWVMLAGRHSHRRRNRAASACPPGIVHVRVEHHASTSCASSCAERRRSWRTGVAGCRRQRASAQCLPNCTLLTFARLVPRAHHGSPAAGDRPKLNGGSQPLPRVRPAPLDDSSGRVLPANVLVCATAVQRIAGLEYPVAVDSVRLGNAGRQGRLSPTVATAGSTLGERRR
ncbi:MAG: hypothetical protein AW07_02618 [Candidatus Accumulibacter sp. SK-11]|nr:MAG: hypothetical protein AW07_02618 [Candidatus Accumulibacter sp. SK-11]